MKKILFALVAVAVATTASAAISGSSHDMRAAAYTNAGNAASACAFCHMPHGGAQAAGAPLWARDIAFNADNAYSYYSSVFTGTTPPVAFGTETKLCLTCHDGTQSVARVLRNSAVGGTKTIASNYTIPTTSVGFVGTRLTDDHPVSVVYTTGNTAGLTGTPPAAFPLFGGGVGTGRVECSSCHEAHAGTNEASAYPTRQFMVTYTGDFCVACHSLK